MVNALIDVCCCQDQQDEGLLKQFALSARCAQTMSTPRYLVQKQDR